MEMDHGGDSIGRKRGAKLRLLCLAAICLLAACGPARVVQGRLYQSYDSSGVTRVILRAAAADAATAEPITGSGPITITGRATGGAAGYHSADPNWRETPAAEWGLDFVASRFGTTLVIASKNEIGYIHHHYVIADIVLQLPPSVQQLPWAVLLFWLGGLPWLVWGVPVRVAASVTGHWLVGHLTHRRGPQGWVVDGVAVQGHDLPLAALVTFGEAWHGNHHAWPDSARLGLAPGQHDPGWWLLLALRRFGLVWDLRTPAVLTPRDGLRALPR